MRLRLFIPVLLLSTLLALLVTWHLLSPPESNTPTVPGEVAEAEDEGVSEPELIEVEPSVPEATGEPVKLAEPPPATEVVNDPGQGQVWFRLVDIDTNRPVANARCALHMMRFGEDYLEADFGWHPPTGWRNTDPGGLLKLTASVDIKLKGDADARFVTDEAQYSECPIPVPQGWYPAMHALQFKSRVSALMEQPAGAPIDVPVRRCADLTVTVRDPWGVPLPDAHASLTGLIHFADPVRFWFENERPLSGNTGPSNWSEFRDETLHTAGVVGVKTTFAGAEDSDDINALREYLTEEGFPATDGGLVKVEGLPQIGVGAVAWHPLYEPGAARMELGPGGNKLDVYLKPRVNTRLHVRVEWLLEDGEDEYDSIFVSIESAGPYGLMDGLSSAGTARFYEYQLPASDTGLWTGTITGLPAGCWLVTVGSGGALGYTSRVAEVKANSDTSVTLYIGEAAAAYFAPTLKFGGEPLDEFTFWIQGGDKYEPQLIDAYYDEADGAEDIELVAGDYTIWMPTHPPQRITLKPGERLSPIYSLQGHEVTFTISERLADVLGGAPVEMLLDAIPESSDDEGALMQTYQWLNYVQARKLESEDELMQLKPGSAITRWMPHGLFWYELYADDVVDGLIDFDADGPFSVHFDVDSLPGVACLELSFANDLPDPEFYFDEGFHWDARIEAHQAEDVGDFGGLDVEFPGEWLDVRVHVIRLSNQEYLAFAPLGVRMLCIEGPEREHRVAVEFPGKRNFSLAGLHSQPLVEVEVVRDGAGVSFDTGFEAIHENGQRWQSYMGLTASFPPGRMRFEVVKEFWGNGDELDLNWAVVEVVLEEEKVVVDLTELTYREYGRVDFVFRGRGSPDAIFDAWWFDPYKEFAPLVECLDYPHGPLPRRVILDGRVEYGHGSPPERRVRGQLLPPGRYRLTPWEGADAKYQREFTVPSGRQVEVVVDTSE